MFYSDSYGCNIPTLLNKKKVDVSVHDEVRPTVKVLKNCERDCLSLGSWRLENSGLPFN
jgi:hypothetical protein